MLSIIYEDNHLIAVNKPSGTLVQGDKTGDESLIDLVKKYLVKKYKKEGEAYLGSPHRIDRPTSGIVLFTKTSKALSRINKQFHDKEVAKTYWAIVKKGNLKKEGTLIHFLKRFPEKNKSIAYDKEHEGSKRAELSYKIIQELDNYFLLEIFPKTGRHHQIRSQLSAIGFPIRGDIKYGYDRTNRDASINLHARRLEFIHPVSKEMVKIKGKLPKTDPVWKACAKLK